MPQTKKQKKTLKKTKTDKINKKKTQKKNRMSLQPDLWSRNAS